MPVRCQDCDHHFLLDATTVAKGISCPECGGGRMERDQPSPTHSDGELRDMVDPATQLDQGGNPLQEGIWANTDGGWQPSYRRDETFAKHQGKVTVSSHDPQFYISMEPYMPWTHEAPKEAATKEAFGPLLALGGRMLLSAALGGLMRKAVGGAGNFLNQGPAPQTDPTANGAPPVNMVASVHESVGVGAPFESPGSVPNLPVDNHDPEAVDQQEFNDGDTSPAFNNPNRDDADAGMAMSTGEDAVNQKLEFRHDGDAVSTAEMLLPKIMDYVNSDKSALEDPQLRALHEQLEKEIPDYLNLADENDESVHKFLESLKSPDKTSASHQGAPVYQTTPMNPNQMMMGPQQQQMGMPGTFQNPVQPGGMPVQGKCQNCGGTLNADGSCPQCGASPGLNQQGMDQGHLQTPGIMPSPYAQRSSADHQGPITPEQQKVFADYLIQQGRNDEVASMMTNPALYAEEWAQFINKSTQPPTIDPSEQPPAPPQPQMDPSQMGQMPMPGMSIPQPTAKTADQKPNPRRCPECKSATTTPMNPDGNMRCHRCGNIWKAEVLEDHPVVSKWKIVAVRDELNEATNPIDAPAADVTAPGDREQQQDSSLSWQSADGSPLQVGQTYEMHNPGYAIPDVVKVLQVKPDSIVVSMVGQYNTPQDSGNDNDPAYQHEISLQEAQTEGLTFNPVDSGEGEQDQSADQGQQDGIGQTVNTQPVEQPHGDFPLHANTAGFQRFAPLSEYDQYFGGKPGAAAKAKAAMIEEYGEKKGEEVFYATVNKKKGSVEIPTDHCPKCDYGHVTSNYISSEAVQYECFRCANRWVVADADEDVTLDEDTRAWLQSEDESDPIGFDPRALAMASTSKSRNIHDIAQRDPRNAQISERLNEAAQQRVAGAKFSPREQKMFIDEDGVARNADRLNLDGTHYESAFDNSKARPDRVDDNYLGLGL